MKSRIAVIYKKEVIDNVRDRRALSASVMSILIGPVMALLIIYILGNITADKMDKPLDLPVSGAEYAPSLIQFLTQHDVNIKPVPEDINDSIRNGVSEVVLIIPQTYPESFTDGEPAAVTLVIDSSRTSATTSIRRAQSLLMGYSRQIGNLRLMARGVNPQVTAAITLETLDLATPQSKALLFLISLPMFLVLSLFIGGMAVVIDATAGERERGSLEPLLINPAKRWEIVLGKLLAAVSFTLVSILLSIAAFAAIFNYVPIDQILNIPVSVNWMTFVVIFLNILPLIFFVTILQMLIVAFARSYKEAQTTLAWLPIIPLLPSVALGYISIQSGPSMMLIPTISQQLLILQYLRGETIPVTNPLIAAGFTLLISLGLLIMTIRIYNREKLLSSN
ncbi:ABC transporter permease [bacterium]|nr:ABC transporter permease [candidate division CSSED10-310 bacterium]